MKTILKKLAFLCLVFIFFTNCQQDDTIIEGAEKHDYGIKQTYITGNDLKSMPKALEMISKIDEKRKKSKTSKSIYSEDYDFFVSTDKILKIDNGSFHSLTFPIYRFPDSGATENLVLSLESDGSYSAFLYTYNLSGQEQSDIAQGIPTLINKAVTRTRLNLFDTTTLAARLVPIWVTRIVVIPCSSSEHNATNFGEWHKCNVIPPRIMVITTMVMQEDNTGNGWITGGEYNTPGSGGGGGGSGNYYNPNITPFDPDKDFGIVQGHLTQPVIFVSNEQIFYNQLNADQKALMQFKNVREPLLNALDKNGFSALSQNVAEFALTHLQNENISEALAIDIFNLAAENIEAANEICIYLEQNNFAEESLEVVANFTDASLKTGLSFDFEKSLKSPFNIDLTAIEGNDPKEIKLKCIYNKLTQSPSFKNFFTQMFQDNSKINVSIEISETPLPQNAEANSQLLISYTNGIPTYTNKIKFYAEYLTDDMPNVDIARILLHEAIHAFLSIKAENCNLGANINNLNNLELAEIINLYYNSFCASDDQHSFMFDHMIPTMSNCLSEIQDLLISEADQVNSESHNYGSPGGFTEDSPFNWNDFYYYLSINGLQNTTQYQEEINANPVQQYLFSQYTNEAFNMTKTCQ